MLSFDAYLPMAECMEYENTSNPVKDQGRNDDDCLYGNVSWGLYQLYKVTQAVKIVCCVSGWQ